MKPRVAMPPLHRPVDVCIHCRQPWPCDGEKARVEQARTVEVRAHADPSLLVQAEAMLLRIQVPRVQA